VGRGAAERWSGFLRGDFVDGAREDEETAEAYLGIRAPRGGYPQMPRLLPSNAQRQATRTHAIAGYRRAAPRQRHAAIAAGSTRRTSAPALWRNDISSRPGLAAHWHLACSRSGVFDVRRPPETHLELDFDNRLVHFGRDQTRARQGHQLNPRRLRRLHCVRRRWLALSSAQTTIEIDSWLMVSTS
jgi:hypothetical protein